MEGVDVRAVLPVGARPLRNSMATSVAHPAESPVARPSESEERSRAWIGRWLFPGLGVVSLLASCVILSLKRPMWGDEVFTHVELSDPSLGHLLSAVTRLGGAGMPLFYLTAWPWAHLFGLSDLSLRLYSSAGVCGAFLILFVTLRRFVRPSSAFLGAGFGLFASLIVVEQNSEARGYGLYVLLGALAVAQLIRVAQKAPPQHTHHFRQAQRGAGMAGLGVLHHVHRQRTHHSGDGIGKLRVRRFRDDVHGRLLILPDASCP